MLFILLFIAKLEARSEPVFTSVMEFFEKMKWYVVVVIVVVVSFSLIVPSCIFVRVLNRFVLIPSYDAFNVCFFFMSTIIDILHCVIGLR